MSRSRSPKALLLALFALPGTLAAQTIVPDPSVSFVARLDSKPDAQPGAARRKVAPSVPRVGRRLRARLAKLDVARRLLRQAVRTSRQADDMRRGRRRALRRETAIRYASRARLMIRRLVGRYREDDRFRTAAWMLDRTLYRCLAADERSLVGDREPAKEPAGKPRS
jgi:hypothetical protein